MKQTKNRRVKETENRFELTADSIGDFPFEAVAAMPFELYDRCSKAADKLRLRNADEFIRMALLNAVCEIEQQSNSEEG